jgi:membrane protein YdbS with pleckstrin-like domain
MTASNRDRNALSDRDPLNPLADPSSPHKAADDTEQVYYEGSPMIRGEMGQMFLWSILGTLFIAAPFVWHVLRDTWWPWYLVVASVVIGLLLLVVPFLIVKRIRYRISNYRIDYERGLLGKKIETLELWHVDDIEFQQSFFDRLMGVGQITVFSNDKTTPRLELKGLPNPRPLFESLKQRIIAVKRQRGVIKMDVG